MSWQHGGAHIRKACLRAAERLRKMCPNRLICCARRLSESSGIARPRHFFCSTFVHLRDRVDPKKLHGAARRFQAAGAWEFPPSVWATRFCADAYFPKPACRKVFSVYSLWRVFLPFPADNCPRRAFVFKARRGFSAKNRLPNPESGCIPMPCHKNCPVCRRRIHHLANGAQLRQSMRRKAEGKGTTLTMTL